MAESINDSSPAFPPSLAAVPASEAGDLYARYARGVNRARKEVAVAAIVCLIGGLTLSELFFIWVFLCAVAALVLIAEFLTRPAPSDFSIRSLLLRWLLVAAVALAFGGAYGIGQGIGAFLGTSLLLGTLREHGAARAILGVLAAVMLGWTAIGTHSPYQYLHWHARKVEESSLLLMNELPAMRGQRPTSYGVDDAVEISPSDPRLPPALQWLRARRICVEEDRVTLFVGRDPLSLSDAVLQVQIHRQPPAKISGYAREHPGTHYGTWLRERVWLKVY